jgi:hypothetical protein
MTREPTSKYPVGEFDLSNTTKLRVQNVEYGKDQYVDVRVFYLEAGTNEFHPTKKGIHIKAEHVSKLRTLLTDALNAIAAGKP